MSPDPNEPAAPEYPPACRHPMAALPRRFVTILILSYAAVLTLLFLAMNFIGERWWPLAVLLYLPQRLFLLPLIILVPAALLAEVSAGRLRDPAWAA